MARNAHVVRIWRSPKESVNEPSNAHIPSSSLRLASANLRPQWNFAIALRLLGGKRNRCPPRFILTCAIGHVHLKVADLDRALRFYRDVLGFELTQRYGKEAAFLSAGGYHHHIGLNTWESEGGSPPPPNSTGLYHLAIAYPTRTQLADALRRLMRAGIPLDGASDHGVSEALYLRDPDGNGVELYWDRPREQWPRTSTGDLAMVTEPLNLDDLLS